MLVLDSPLKSLEVVLAGAVTTNQLPWTITYDDLIQSTMALSEVIEADGTTNDSTAVSMSSTPTLVAGIRRTLKFLSIPNTDTVQATVTVRVNNNGTFRTVKKAILAANDILEFTAARGFYVSDSVGNLKVSLGFGDPVPVTHGGTGLATLTANAILIGAGTSAVAFTAVGATNTLLHGNTGAAPTYSAVVNADIAAATIDLTAKVTGLLPIANGGTGAATVAANTVFGNPISGVAAPLFTATPSVTSLTSPLLLGGIAVGSTLTLKTTTAVGVGGADMIFVVGNNGDIEALRLRNSGDVQILGNLGIGTAPAGGIALFISLAVANLTTRVKNTQNNGRTFLQFQGDTAEGINLTQNGSTVAGTFMGVSSAKLSNIEFDNSAVIDTSSVGSSLTFGTKRIVSLTIDSSQNVNVGTGTQLQVVPAGSVSFYKNIATVSNGVPAEYAAIDTTGLVANVAASTLYAVPATGAGMYRVSAYVVETVAGSVSSTLPNVQVIYTDNETGGSITIDVTPVLGVAGIGQTGALTANTIGTVSSGEIPINVKASTTIQYQTVNYASTAAGMTYALHLKLEAL